MYSFLQVKGVKNGKHLKSNKFFLIGIFLRSLSFLYNPFPFIWSRTLQVTDATFLQHRECRETSLRSLNSSLLFPLYQSLICLSPDNPHSSYELSYLCETDWIWSSGSGMRLQKMGHGWTMQRHKDGETLAQTITLHTERLNYSGTKPCGHMAKQLIMIQNIYQDPFLQGWFEWSNHTQYTMFPAQRHLKDAVKWSLISSFHMFKEDSGSNLKVVFVLKHPFPLFL